MSQKDGLRDSRTAQAASALKAFTAGPVPVAQPAPITPDDLIMNDFDAEYVLARQHAPGCWVHSPANAEFLSLGVSGLQRNAREREVEGRVSKVRAAKVKHKKLVYIWATRHDDPDGIPVKYYRHTAWINLITLLGPLKLTEKTGFKTRYALEPAGDDSPVGPALVLHLGRKLERRREEKNGSKKSKSSKGKGKNPDQAPAQVAVPQAEAHP